jgi:cytochrome bd-type quinol oxidase subunit 2
MVLFFLDFIVPLLGMMGILWVVQHYEEQKTLGTILIVIFVLYLIGRAFWMLYPTIFKKDVSWDKTAARQISCIFLARLNKSIPKESLDERRDGIQEKIREMEVAMVEGNSTVISRIIDILIAVAILVAVCVLTWGVGWGDMLGESITGTQGASVDSIFEIVAIAFLVATVIRIGVGVAWFFPTFQRISLKLRRLSFQVLFVLAGVVLVPVLSMILRSTDTKKVTCPYNHFMDFRSNTPTFIDYFMERTILCQNCSRTAASSQFKDITQCSEVCIYNTSFPLEYKVLKDAQQVNEDDLSRIYLIPINL